MDLLKQDVYLKVADYIKKCIELNLYDKDSCLPSCRKLALEMKVNPNTVAKAYEYLESLGLVYSQPKKGYFINNNNRAEKDETKKMIEREINYLKDKGITKEEIINTIEKLYKEGE